MRKYKNSFWNCFLDGIASIGEAFLSFNIFPPPTKKIKPYDWENDYKKKQSDLDKIGGDFQKVMTDFDKAFEKAKKNKGNRQ